MYLTEQVLKRLCEQRMIEMFRPIIIEIKGPSEMSLHKNLFAEFSIVK